MYAYENSSKLQFRSNHRLIFFLILTKKNAFSINKSYEVFAQLPIETLKHNKTIYIHENKLLCPMITLRKMSK